MTKSLRQRPTPSTLLAHLVESPGLVSTIRGLPAQTFASLIRNIGVEDSGELVALASIDQIVTAFDEDLFVNAGPGQRERFDPHRFAVWLEILLEAGDAVAAKRVAELSQDFLVHALSSLIVVLDHDALLFRMDSPDPAAYQADKALESALAEEIDGYLLVSRWHEGWDALLALILALDRDYRSLLEVVLDRCAAMAQEYIDDLDALTAVLSSAESLALDVEAEREDRRGRLGFVEAQAAKAFLALARKPFDQSATAEKRDPLTRAYFRELEGHRTVSVPLSGSSAVAKQIAAMDAAVAPTLRQLERVSSDTAAIAETSVPIVEALVLLRQEAPDRFEERAHEMAYLANVLQAGATLDARRFRPAEAAEAALATVALGAALIAGDKRGAGKQTSHKGVAPELCDVLREWSADALFRKASRALAENRQTADTPTFLRTHKELPHAIRRCSAAPRSDSHFPEPLATTNATNDFDDALPINRSRPPSRPAGR